MYLRLYPSKNNTIFRYKDAYSAGFTFPMSLDNFNSISQNLSWSITTNTGANPVMELMDGKGESRLLFQFQLPSWLQTKLTNNTFTCNFQIYDAGTLYNPALPPKLLQLDYFTDDFVEGDGYSFLQNAAFQEVSNFLYRVDTITWESTTFSPISTYNFNSYNEDLTFVIDPNIITTSITNTLNPSFSLWLPNQSTNLSLINAKYFTSNYTKTVFKPYLEFFINDTILDDSTEVIAGQSNTIYLLNQRGTNFSTTPTPTVTNNEGNILTTITSVVNSAPGVYSFTITPPMPSSLAKSYLTILWNIGGINKYKQVVKICDPDLILEPYDSKNLYFYPTTNLTHTIARQGDILPFDVVSQIRGQGDIIRKTYEFAVYSMDGFVMVPWTQVSVYKEDMFFMLDTSFFFPELEYEVFVRNVDPSGFTVTSPLTYKFKLTQQAQSHLRSLSASPYFSRDYYFSK